MSVYCRYFTLGSFQFVGQPASKIFSRNCSIIFVGCRFIAYFSVYGAVDILLWNVFFHKIKKSVAPGEARTHGLQIMRLTRCLLRYGGYREILAKN